MEIRRTVFDGSVDDWIVIGKDIFFFSFFSLNSEILTLELWNSKSIRASDTFYLIIKNVFRYNLIILALKYLKTKMWRKSFVTNKLYNLLSKKYDRYMEKNRLNGICRVLSSLRRFCDEKADREVAAARASILDSLLPS